MAKKQFSLFLEEDNYKKLKAVSENNNIPCGIIVNLLIEAMDSDVKLGFKPVGLNISPDKRN